MNIYDPPTKVLTIDLKLFIWLTFFLLLINTTQFLRSDATKFFIFLWRISLWLWHHTFWVQFAPHFPSQTSFRNKTFSTLSLFRDWHLKSSFVKEKKNVRRYIGTSLRMYQDQARSLTNHSWQSWRFIYNNQMYISRCSSHLKNVHT